MYAFALFSMPLSFLALSAWTFRSGKASYRAFARGLLLGIPAALLWTLARPLLAPAWGSPLLVLAFFARYWLVPFGLATVAYALAMGFPGLARGNEFEYERSIAFFSGQMSVFGVAHAVSSWGDPSRVMAIAIPLMLVASVIAFPAILEEAVKEGIPGAVKYIALAFAAFTLAALGAALFFMRLEWLGALITALYSVGAALLGWKRLARPERPARPATPER